METAFESLIQVFEADELQHQADFEHKVVTAGFEGKNVFVHVHFVLEDECLLQIFALVPIKVQEGCRPVIAEAITRANYGMRVGKFEMDFADGALRFQIGNAFPEGRLDGEVVRRLIGTAIHVVDRYFPAFMSIIYGNELPKDAVDQVEQA